jgi:hypothetical protein
MSIEGLSLWLGTCLGEHVADKILIRGLPYQLNQGHSVIGHRRLRFGSMSCNPNLPRRPATATRVTSGRSARATPEVPHAASSCTAYGDTALLTDRSPLDGGGRKH